MIKIMGVGQATHLARMMEMRYAQNILIAKTWKEKLGTNRHKWEDNITIMLKKQFTRLMQWIYVAEDGNQWPAPVNMWTLEFHMWMEISWPAKRLSAFQDWLCSTEPVVTSLSTKG